MEGEEQVRDTMDNIAAAASKYIETMDPQLQELVEEGANEYKFLVSFLLLVKGVMDALTLPTVAISRGTELLMYVVDMYVFVCENKNSLSDSFFIDALDKSPYSLSYMLSVSSENKNAGAFIGAIDALSKMDKEFIGRCSSFLQRMRF